MSILVGNIRLPLGAADAEALEAAAKKCGLSMRELCGAHIYRASIDARRGKITRVLSVLLDLAETQREEAVVARVGKNDVRLKKPAQQPGADRHGSHGAPTDCRRFGAGRTVRRLCLGKKWLLSACF